MYKYKNYLDDFLGKEKKDTEKWFNDFRASISQTESPFLFQKSIWTEQEIISLQEETIAEFILRIEAIEKAEERDPKIKGQLVKWELMAKSRFSGKMEGVRELKKAELLYYKYEFTLFKTGVYRYLLCA